MTCTQCCIDAALAPACLKNATLSLTPYHLELIHAAREAYRRVLATRAIGPHWQAEHAAWLNSAESLALAIIHKTEREARHD